MTLELWTIGHSDRPAEAFVQALAKHEIRTLADVRRFPHSRRHPQFNVDGLRKALHAAGIRYEYHGDSLGGFRDARADSRHVSLQGTAFQGFADHADTAAFERGLARVRVGAAERRWAVACSERQPKDCHRKIIADHLVLLHGARVHHILDANEVVEHAVTRTARLVAGQVLYAPSTLAETSREADG